MLNWLWKRHEREGAPHASRGSNPAVLDTGILVSFDNHTITVRQANGKTDTLAWADLVTVMVITSDQGPFVTDLFWILQSRDSRRSMVVPMGASGEHELLQAMQQRLHGFDNMSVVEAMGSTSNASFKVWEKGQASQ